MGPGSKERLLCDGLDSVLVSPEMNTIAYSYIYFRENTRYCIDFLCQVYRRRLVNLERECAYLRERALVGPVKVFASLLSK